jgi:hypothetical protein
MSRGPLRFHRQRSHDARGSQTKGANNFPVTGNELDAASAAVLATIPVVASLEMATSEIWKEEKKAVTA